MKQSPAHRLPCVRSAAIHFFPKLTRNRGLVCAEEAISGSPEGIQWGLRNAPLPQRPEPERSKGRRTNAVDAAVHAEEKAVGLPSGDLVTAAMRTDTPVFVMLFNESPDLLEIGDDLAVWAQKEVFRNHSIPPDVPSRRTEFRAAGLRSANIQPPDGPAGSPPK